MRRSIDDSLDDRPAHDGDAPPSASTVAPADDCGGREDGRATSAGAAGHPGGVLASLGSMERLRVLGAVALGASGEADVAAVTGLPSKPVAAAVRRLLASGVLVREDDGSLRADSASIERAARTAGRLRPEVTPEQLGATAEQAVVLRSFLDDGKLRSLPVQQSKRRVVLDFLAQRFVPGEVYPEREVNRILAAFNPDYAALRRALIDEEFLERREGFYWRSGGSFDIG